MPLLDLDEVAVGGPCSSKELVTLLSLGLNLRKIRLGASCQPTDSTISEVRTYIHDSVNGKMSVKAVLIPTS